VRPLDEPAARDAHIRFTDGQHAALLSESVRTGLSLAELVRRAVDAKYRKKKRTIAGGYQFNAGFRRGADAADVARLTQWPRRIRD
jgi:hypothetical protein